MKPIRLIASFFTVGIWTLASRVLGFVRDILIAGYLGTGFVAQAFLIAFSLPNLFRRFFAEGAFNMAFIPMFSKKLERDDGAKAFAQDAFVIMAVILSLFTALGMVFMPGLVTLMAAGFRGDARFDLTVDFGRIAFAYILFISLAALLSGVLNALGRFAVAAAAPVLLNVIFIAAIALGLWTGASAPENLGPWLIWAVPLAGIAQLALVWRAAANAGYGMRLGLPMLTPDIKRLAMIAAPVALTGGVVQINLLVGRQVASFFDGAVAWLSYADRLYQLPLGVVGIAIGVVLLPDLSRRLGAKDDAGGQDALNRALELGLALTVPAAVALAVIPGALVGVLFERGAFTATDTTATALAVAVYGIGLPAFVIQKALQPLFFAREDTRRPFYYALAAMVLNLAIAVGLAPFVGFIAAAIGTSATGWVMVVLLWRGSRDMGLSAQLDLRFKARLPRMMLASAGMGLVLALGAWTLSGALETPGLRYAALTMLVLAGIVSYFALAQVLGALRLSEIRRALRRS